MATKTPQVYPLPNDVKRTLILNLLCHKTSRYSGLSSQDVWRTLARVTDMNYSETSRLLWEMRKEGILQSPSGFEDDDYTLKWTD